MTKIEGDYLVTDEASVAVLFYDSDGIENTSNAVRLWHKTTDWESLIDMIVTQPVEYKIRIPRALVRELIEPVEGEVAICEWECHGDKSGIMLLSADEAADPLYKDDTKYNWRLVNMCQDYGELRKLVEWARG